MCDPKNIDLLIVVDDADFRSTIVRRCRRRGFRVWEASDGEEALSLMERSQFDVAILDMVLPGLSDLDVFERLKDGHSECEVIVLTGEKPLEMAVRGMSLRANHCLSKPFPMAELELLIQKAYERRQLSKENRQLKAFPKHRQPKWKMIGQSPAMQDVFHLIERAGPTDKAVLIRGESGTGKELVARALHENSPRADKPLVVINCASMSEELLEGELFGHEKGTFTGALSEKPGLFEVADGGTLMLDGIGEMPAAMQAKLLRVLENGSTRRVGSIREREVNVRLLSSTTRNISEEVKTGRFCGDLRYRLSEMMIVLPPLRSRTSDISLLVSHFLGPDWTIEDEALGALKRYHWPGNVRQMISAIERAKILANRKVVRTTDLPDEVLTSPPSEPGYTGA